MSLLKLKIPAAPPPLGGIFASTSSEQAAMLRQACRESSKCKEVDYCNSLTHPAAPMSGIYATLQQACGGMRSLSIFILLWQEK